MLISLTSFSRQDRATDPTTNAGAGNGGGTPAPATTQGTTPQGQPAASPQASQPPPVQQTQAPAQPAAQPNTQLQQQFGPLLQEVERTVQAAVQPIRDQQQQFAGRLDQLSRPVMQGSRLFGGAPGSAPGVRTGEDPLTSRGYQYWRAMGYRQQSQYCPADRCKVELDWHDRLYKFYVEQHGLDLAGSNSILVPLGSELIAEFDDGLAREIQQSLRAGMSGFDIAQMQAEAHRSGVRRADVQQALSMWDDSAGGIFTDAGIAGEIIALMRNREVISRAGATNLSLPPNGHLKFGRQTGAMTGYWVGEAEEITESNPTTGHIELRAKKAAALVTVPNELLRFGTPSTEAFLRADMSRVLALLIDKAALEGTGSGSRPKGIINYSGINSVTAGTVATDGNTFEPEDVSLMLAEIEDDNHDPDMDGFTWVMRGRMWHNLVNRRTGVASAADRGGPWLFTVNREDIGRGAPAALQGHPVIRSNQVANDREKGASSDLTYILGGIFQHLIVGRVGVLEFAMSTQGDTVFKQDQSKLRAIQHVDTALRYEDAFVWCDDIDMDLPA